MPGRAPRASAADTPLPVALDDALVARAKAEGVANEYHRIPGGTQGFDGTQFFTAKVDGEQTPYDRLLDFAVEHLADR